jgi:hypothetical protein
MADYYGPKVGTLAGQDASNVAITGGSISGVTFNENFITSSNPAANAAVTTAIVDSYNGVVVTLSAAGNTQTIQNPTTAATIRKFTIINNDTSNNNLSVVANSVTFTLTPGEGQCFLWDGSAWGPTDLGITDIPVKVVQGGTGASTLTDHGVLLGSGTDPITALGVAETGQLLAGVSSTDPAFIGPPTINLSEQIQYPIPTSGYMLKAAADGSPATATNTDAQVADAVSKAHTQNTDTGTTATSFKINTGGSEADLQTTGLTADRDYTLPDIDTMLAGSVLLAQNTCEIIEYTS